MYHIWKKGFLIKKIKRIFTDRVFDNGRIKGYWLGSNLGRLKAKATTICADRAHLSLGLIYQAVSGNRPQDFDPEEHVLSPTTGSRTNGELGYSWLTTTVFDRETKGKEKITRGAGKFENRVLKSHKWGSQGWTVGMMGLYCDETTSSGHYQLTDH